MYDVSRDGTVSKQDLSTLLNHVPKSVLAFSGHYNANQPHRQSAQSDVASESSGTSESPDIPSLGSSFQSGSAAVPSGVQGAAAPVPEDEEFDDVDQYTNHDVVERAFEECDLNHEGRLTYEEFKMWVQRTPSVIEYFEDMLPYS
eukprot:gene499-532_t